MENKDHVIDKIDLHAAGDYIQHVRPQALRDDIYDIKLCDGFKELPELTQWLVTDGYLDHEGNRINPLERKAPTKQ